MTTSIRTFGFLSVATALMGLSPVWAAGPATGEFSAVDMGATTPAAQTRAHAQEEGQAALAADAIATGEFSAADFSDGHTSAVTRAAVRQEGQDALKAKAIPSGERTI
ncbi:MAG: hypothetical protein RLZZ612_1355 [Pseudomonadota bacterium]